MSIESEQMEGVSRKLGYLTEKTVVLHYLVILAGIKRDRNVSRELKKRKGKKVWETCLTSYLFCFILFYIVLMLLYFQSKSDIIPDIMDMDR